MFCNLPPNFIKVPNKSWPKFCPFRIGESERMLKKTFFSTKDQNLTIVYEILISGQKNLAKYFVFFQIGNET
jgi:hypothetical protein